MSPEAFLLAAVAVTVSSAFMFVFVKFLGASVYFAPYIPAVLIVSLFAGAFAATFAAVVSALVVWWIFLPPPSSGGPLTISNMSNLGLFALGAVLMVWLGHVFRSALSRAILREHEKELLVGELLHRAGNTLAVVSSIVRATLKNDPEKADIIGGRLRAMLKADELIIRSHEHPDLRGILASEFCPYQIEQRVEMHGQRIDLPAKVARNIALVFHELTTNAVKHGSLSHERGRLRIAWERNDGMVTVNWDEFDGPLISEPTTLGQGSRLIRAALAEVNGSVVKEFLATGLSCQVCFEVGHAQGASGSAGLELASKDSGRPDSAPA
nr:HWE histidine kinase domain-containing protein [Bradyrhizobium japonicum]